MNRPVVVGVDGSPSSLVAAEHAARSAVQRSRPLHLVHGYLHPLGYGVPLNPYDLGVPAPTEEAQKMLEQAAADLTDRHPGLTVEVRQVAGGPGAALIEESRRAELVVVGSRGHGGFAGLLLGSVSTQVAQHGHCPVLVVRPAEQPIPMDGPVVVGVDGSESAALAVRLAADEAVRRDTALVLLHVRPADRARMVPEEVAESAAAGDAESADLLAAAAGRVRADQPGLSVTERPVQAAKPEQALIEASGDAALVVVGSRGRGGFAGLLLGSVSQALVQHAHCAVLVAHPYEQAD
ncbi:Nucleotide-binding universal stress protein, UspA family [Micromonospora rhizosphaerae]|uniref:Nucleotide-binding universal stress protein, UspA family n=1 Tax=Micromonospora rhizosphaerae TaxID=568872 RepID=A0A1C6S7J5_9ACTN|nr:universal stress protein [Micromonospora rhizosphaerae]SCL25440.1 Nucleotide-binding universal stress protein, UspA family [Micromonospora rhizosphaerae]